MCLWWSSCCARSELGGIIPLQVKKQTTVLIEDFLEPIEECLQWKLKAVGN